MSQDRDRSLEQAFAHAVSLAPEERAGYLAALRESDLDFALALQALLEADAEQDRDIFAPVEELLREFNENSDNYWIKRRVGPWQIEKRIAAGGMGAVFLAQRADGQFEQSAAIKIMGVQLLATDAIRRFRVERQILAGLSHPGIARLYDGGTTENDLPYLAMEYIDGETIDRHCDRAQLGIEERLRLFRKVCAAVSYLHANLVVHRDIKPSNILVDNNGEPKLLDFGIAKLLDSDVGLTIDGGLALTPGFASPEQITGETVSTASDVYALGALLYLLLSGSPPHRAGPGGVTELMRATLEQTPVAPSKLLDTEGDTDQARVVAEHRGLPVARLRRVLAGDLDNIALLALRKAPGDRYSSAERLSDDIARYLGRKPVTARPESLAYRALRFWQRHAISVSLGILTLVAVTGFSLFTLWQAGQLERQRDRATREARTAESVAEFMAGIFEVSDPVESLGNRVTAREVLDNAALRIEYELGDEPELRARLSQVMGRVYRSLGIDSAAQTLLDSALDINREIHGERHPTVVQAYSELGLIQAMRGDAQGQENHLRRALALARDLAVPDPQLVAQQELLLAAAQRMRGKFSQARQLLTDAQARLVRAAPTRRATDLSLAVQRELILLYTDEGDFQSASALAETVLARTRSRHASPHPEIARSLSDWGYVLRWYDRFEQALPLMEEALSMDRQIFGPTHYEVIEDLYDLGSLHERHRHDEPARAYLEQVIALAGASTSGLHPIAANAHNDLANIEKHAGRFALAEQHYQRALEVNRSVYGNKHLEVATNISNLAILHGWMGQQQRAVEGLQEALAMRRALLGNEHPHVAFSLSLLGSRMAAQGDWGAAEGYARQAMVLRDQLYGEDHPMAAGQRARLGRILLKQGRLDEAEPLLDSAAATVRSTPGGNRSHFAMVLTIRAELHLARMQYGAALAAVEESGPDAAQVFVPGSAPRWNHQLAGARALLGLDRPRGAQALLSAALHAAEDAGRTTTAQYLEAASLLEDLSSSGHQTR